MTPQVSEWLYRAEIDILSARKLFEDSVLFASTLFHIHQAVEKSFKAILENSGEHIPKTHDLQRLAKLVESKSVVMPIDLDSLDEMNAVYLMSRYPGDGGPTMTEHPSESTVTRLLETAADVVETVKSVLIRDG